MTQAQGKVAEVLIEAGWLSTPEIIDRYRDIHGVDINTQTLLRTMQRMRKREGTFEIRSRRRKGGKNTVEYELTYFDEDEFLRFGLRGTRYRDVVAYMEMNPFESFQYVAKKFDVLDKTVSWLAKRYGTQHNYKKTLNQQPINSKTNTDIAKEGESKMHEGKLFKLSFTMMKFNTYSDATEILEQYEKDHGETINNQSFGSCLRLMYRQPECFGIKKKVLKNKRHYKMTFFNHSNYKGEIDGDIHGEVLKYMKNNSFRTFSDIAIKFGISARAVSRLANQHGLYENHTNYEKVRAQNEKTSKKGIIWLKAPVKKSRISSCFDSRDENGKLTWNAAHRLMNKPAMFGAALA